MMEASYNKRIGTSSIGGDLYKIKLTSRILFRLLHDDTIENFQLASNMDEIGSFGDICFRLKIKKQYPPIFVFMHVKHKDEDEKKSDKKASLNFDAVPSFIDSYVRVKKLFYSSKNTFFNHDFNNVELIFILHTNAKYYDVLNSFPSTQITPNLSSEMGQSKYESKLKEIISTTDENPQGIQANVMNKDIEFIKEKILEDDITMLAEHFFKYLNEKQNDSMNIMFDDYILRYHVILARNVVNISKIKYKDNHFDANSEYIPTIESYHNWQYHEQNMDEVEQWRDLTFKPDFFDTKDENLNKFKQKICNLTIDNIRQKHTLDDDASLSTEYPNKQKDLEQIDDESAKNVLLSFKIKVPPIFGNMDLLMVVGEMGVEAKLNIMADLFATLCSRSTFNDPFKIVTVDQMVGSLFFCSNCFGSAIGNLLIYDNVTKFLMINDNITTLEITSKTLFKLLDDKIENLKMYRFNMKCINIIPKLNFDCSEEAKVILNKLQIYDRQSDCKEIDDKLERDINETLRTTDVHTVHASSVVMYYNYEVLNWWMSPKTGFYLTKASTIYNNVLKTIIKEPEISALQNTFYINSMEYDAYKFNENAIECLQPLLMNLRTIVASKILMLTAIKVIEFFRKYNINHLTILSLDCVLDMPYSSFMALHAELKKSDKILIVICNYRKYSRFLHNKFDLIAETVQSKKLIVITDSKLIETVQEYFECQYIFCDDCQSLKELTVDSLTHIKTISKLIFQGFEASMEMFINDESLGYVKNGVLYKIICNEPLIIGKPLGNSNYKSIKHLHIDRRLIKMISSDSMQSMTNTKQPVKTFYDICDHFVLITADFGMGKSTLLTHLSIESKKQDVKPWIVRINLSDHSNTFSSWQKHIRTIDSLKALKLICETILPKTGSPIDLKEIDGKVYLDSHINDDWTTFEINMFLHFYNEENLILLFDGFDEICPYYTKAVLHFLNIVKHFQRRQKIWITCTLSNKMLGDLQDIASECYKLDYFNNAEQIIYLNNYWKGKLIIPELNSVQLKNVIAFIDFMNSKMYQALDRMFYVAYDYVIWHFPHIINTTHQKYLSEIDSGDVKTNDILLGNPIFLCSFGEHFVNLINDKNINNSETNTHFSIFAVYELFVKKIFQENNSLDPYKPDTIRRFEREYSECITKHKNIAAYAFIFDKVSLDVLKTMQPFNEEEYKAVIRDIQSESEYTLFISHITSDNIPVFTYTSLGQYFAAEFLCDVFKSDKFEYNSKVSLYDLVKQLSDLYCWIIRKREIDGDLGCILNDLECK